MKKATFLILGLFFITSLSYAQKDKLEPIAFKSRVKEYFLINKPCDSLPSWDDKKLCTMTSLNDFFFDRIDTSFLENRAEGAYKVEISFDISEAGDISNAIVTSESERLKQEFLKLIDSIPNTYRYIEKNTGEVKASSVKLPINVKKY